MGGAHLPARISMCAFSAETGNGRSVTAPDAGMRLCGRALQPAADKTGAAQPAHDIGRLAHRPPDRLAAVIGEHTQDRTLIDPEIIGGDPTMARVNRSGDRKSTR